MTVSVIIPTYNRTQLLTERALPSVFGQSVQDFEVLVIGDGTEQATVDAMANEPRVRFWNLPHDDYPEDHEHRWGIVGLTALNFGLDQAQGAWIAVLADDDEWTPDHLEVLLAAAEHTGVDHVYGISETYKDGQPTGQRYGAWPPGPAQLCNGANIYRSALNYRYDLRCYIDRDRTGDADLWLRMIEGGVTFHFEPRVVLRYHRNWP